MRLHVMLLGLATPLFLEAAVVAGPIRVTFEGWTPEGNVSYSSLLPDDIATRGTQISLGAIRLQNTGTIPTGGVWRGDLSGSVFGLLTFNRDPQSVMDPQYQDLPAISIRANLNGSTLDDGIGGMDGHWEGVAAALATIQHATTPHQIGPADYERWERDLGISRALLEQFLAPNALMLSGDITGGRQNILPIVLTVAPTQVPEPAAWVTWIVVAAGVCACRRQRRGSQ